MASIYFVLLPQVHILDFAGPAHVFYEADLLGYDYTLKYISIDKKIISAQKLEFSNLELFDATEPSTGDIIFIPGISFSGLDEARFRKQKKEFYQWLKMQHKKGIRICAICTGTFVMGQSGLLTNNICTTHWKLIDKLRCDFPDIRLANDVLFVEDDNIITSAGVTSGIDLALGILEETHGPLLAAEVAKEMIVYLRRNAGSKQLSIYLQYRSHFNKEIHRVQDWLTQNLEARNNLSDLAEIANMSKRNLSRVFKKATGLTISDYILMLRMEKAKKLFSNPELSIIQIAERCGFKSERQLRRIWSKHEKVPLSKLRKMA